MCVLVHNQCVRFKMSETVMVFKVVVTVTVCLHQKGQREPHPEQCDRRCSSLDEGLPGTCLPSPRQSRWNVGSPRVEAHAASRAQPGTGERLTVPCASELMHQG